MSIDSFIFIDVISNASYLLTAVAFFMLSALFFDALIAVFDIKTCIKSLGFCILGLGWIFHLPWLMSGALFLLFIAFALDPFSKMRFAIPLMIIFPFFISGHILAFVFSLMITFVILQLAYSTSHRDLIPLGVGFTLISVGEYLYHLKTIESISQLSAAGSFLYLFASLILLGWVWLYLALRFIKKF